MIREPKLKLSAINEFLWALTGLLLTIFCTFLGTYTTNAPWNWGGDGVIPQPLSITYQIGAVLLTGCLGGKNAGALAQMAYVILGLTSLPIFAQGGGWDYWQELSFGYILGFIPGAWLCGWMAFRNRPTVENLALAGLCGLLVIHLCGLLYLVGLSLLSLMGSQILPLGSLPSAMFNYSLIVLPGQLVIVCVVALISYFLRLILFY